MTSTLHLSQGKLTPRHLARKAVIYIRQSSPKQVRDHLDSQLTQRALVERAQALGWHADRIEVLDGDLGQSATGGQEREDFKALAAEVALGHVGVVFGWQVSRLARNNAEWYQLLDLAALFATLIGDTDGLYDPRLYNDRLLLGLKGTMSEAEHYLLRQRLNAGRVSKVQRGEEQPTRLPSSWCKSSRVKCPCRHVAIPHPEAGNPSGDAWCKRPGRPVGGLRWERSGGLASGGA
jgi:DNA invertase Pin-like site-specific DNA recombinase